MEKKKKKGILITMIIGLAFFSIIALTLLNQSDFAWINKLFSQEAETTNEFVYLYEPDYEANIFENREYLGKNRYIQYKDGALTLAVGEEEYTTMGDCIALFGQYFDALTHGDVERYNQFFTEDFFADQKNPYHEKKEKFTMQKIYDIRIEKLEETILEDTTITQSFFSVSFCIMRNDGTFRSDLPSNAAIPLVYEVLTTPDGTKINSISRYTYQ